MMTRRMCTGLAAAALMVALVTAQKPDAAETLMQTAIKKEVVDGNLAGAIEGYKKALAAAKGNRAVATNALVHLGQCYEKLGDAESRKAYERVVREYGDQKEPVAAASARLAALGKPAMPIGTTVRQAFEGLPGDAGAVSPDGRMVIYYENRTPSNYMVRDLITGQIRKVTSYDKSSGELEYDPLFSPDSRRIAYASWPEKCELHIVGADGSGDRVVFRTSDYIELKGWFPDGSRVIALLSPDHGPRKLLSVSTIDGSTKVLKEGDATLASGGWLSQDGRYFAFLKQNPKDPLHTDVWCLSLENASETPLVVHPARNWSPRWTPNGKGLLFVSDRRGTSGLWYLPVSAGKADGVPELIKGDVGESLWPIGLTTDGTMYYQVRTGATDVFMAEFDPTTGKIVSSPSEIAPKFSGHTQDAAFSTDGQWLAYYRKTSGYRKTLTLILRSLTTGMEREIATRFTDALTLRWFPDGRSLMVYATDSENGRGYHRFDIATGKSTLLRKGGDGLTTLHTLSPDGKTVYLVKRRQGGTHYVLCSWNIETGEEHELLENDNASLHPAISPDGRHLAIARIHGDDSLIEVLPTGGGGPREVFKARAAEALLGLPNWSPDGHEIFFARRAPRGRFELWRIPAQGGAPSKTDFSVQPSVLMLRSLTFHPDGRRFAFDAGIDRLEYWALENFLPGTRSAR